MSQPQSKKTTTIELSSKAEIRDLLLAYLDDEDSVAVILSKERLDLVLRGLALIVDKELFVSPRYEMAHEMMTDLHTLRREVFESVEQHGR